MSRIDFKTKLLEKLEDGLLEWEDVCRECIAEMSTDQVEDMCDYCDYFLDEEDVQDDPIFFQKKMDRTITNSSL